MEAKSGNEVEQVQTLPQSRGFRLQRATERTLDEVPPDLGAGEREAIALALEVMADLVILDDQQGRHVARERGLPVTGTVGILIEARERRMIPSVRHELDHLIEAACGSVRRFITESYRSLASK